MAEEFEFQDLSGSVFWGVDLRGSTFRDVDLTGSRLFRTFLVDVDVDGPVERLTINGVDVTDYVNERDPWYPVRRHLRPADPDGFRGAWPAIQQAWSPTIERARHLTDAEVRTQVDGEWSFLQTLRHLLFAMDKWFTVPVLGEGFHPAGMPNSGSIDFPWPCLDRDADPTLDEVLAARAQRAARLGEHLQTLDADELAREVEVLENGVVPVSECFFTVFEEEFEHQRYALRDLDRLRSSAV
jgi:hypothetical protein